ncbi:probable transcription factor Ken [Homalodisca vitripennis]|nr:probable transcription factor Ken [Homalodisca vitripennis]KAG8308332.1 hypothetical protein J6590_002421 [Homalodisca vitripennis]
MLEKMPPGSSFVSETSPAHLRQSLPPDWSSAYVCRCGRKYKLLPSLKLHLRFECGKEPSFSCQFCERRFHHKGSLKRHLYTIHGNTA